VNEPAEGYELFSNPRELIRDGHIAKQLRRQHLGSIFSPAPKPTDDEVVLDRLIDHVAGRVVERLVGEPEPEQPETAEAAGGFDGGARASVPLPPPSHDSLLIELLRSRAADVGGHF
jgi:hypothetical protein